MTVSPWKLKDRIDDPRLEAARKRLRESTGQADAIEAIREIVTNLLGCEEIGLFTIDRGKSKLLWSFGIDPERHQTLAAFGESVLQRVLEGEVHIAKSDGNGQPENSPLRAFIPILLHGRTAAVLVMLKLLPQKLSFDEADISLVKLISDEAGKSLLESSTSAHA